MFCLLSDTVSVIEFVILYANMLVYRRIFVQRACICDCASTCICDKMKNKKYHAWNSSKIQSKIHRIDIPNTYIHDLFGSIQALQ